MQSNESQQIFNQIGKIFRRRKLLIIVCVLGVLAPTIYFNETSTPIYEGSTMVVFEEFTGPLSTFNYDASREIFIFNRLEEIKSLAFAEDVVRSIPMEILNKISLPSELPENFDKFQFVTYKLVSSISAYPVTKTNIVRIGVKWNDPYMCMVLANAAADVLLERNYKIRQEGVGTVRKFIEEQLLRVRDELNSSEEALKTFKEQNRITSFTRESEEVLRRLTEAEVLYNQVKSNRGSLEVRLASIQEKLAQQKKDIVPSITNIGSPYAQRLKEKLVGLQSELANLTVLGYTSEHPKIIQLTRDISETKKTLAEEAMKLVQEGTLTDPLMQMEKYVNESFTLQIELEAIKAHEAALKNIAGQYTQKLDTLPDKEYSLVKLTRDRDVNNNIYMSLLQKLEEAKISEAEKIANIRIIDKARLPTLPVRPRKLLNITVGLMLSLILGLGLAFILEVFDKTLDSSEELEKLTQWHVLATIPTIDKASSNGKSKILNGRKPFQKEDFIKRGKISSLDPKSGIAESYRMLRTNLQFQGIGKDHKTILFTSIGPDEGKSTTLVNLAISIASLGQQVLVLDADLRKPILHAILGVDKEPGLSEILVNYSAMTEELPIVEAPKSLLGNLVKEPIGSLVDNFSDFILEEQFITKINNLKQTNNISILNSVLVESMQVTEIENLRILTSGKQLKNPSETISSVAMKSLIDELKQRYNIILIDSAPIMLVPETMILSALVDGVIFVVDAKKYNEEMLLKARNLLNKTKADVLGAVLNNVELGGIYKDNYYYHA